MSWLVAGGAGHVGVPVRERVTIVWEVTGRGLGRRASRGVGEMVASGWASWTAAVA